MSYCPLCNSDTHVQKASAIIAAQSSEVIVESSSDGTIYSPSGRMSQPAFYDSDTTSSSSYSTKLAQKLSEFIDDYQEAVDRPLSDMYDYDPGSKMRIATILGFGLMPFGIIGFLEILRHASSYSIVEIAGALAILLAYILIARWRQSMVNEQKRIEALKSSWPWIRNCKERERKVPGYINQLWYCHKHDLMLWPTMDGTTWEAVSR